MLLLTEEMDDSTSQNLISNLKLSPKCCQTCIQADRVLPIIFIVYLGMTIHVPGIKIMARLMDYNWISDKRDSQQRQTTRHFCVSTPPEQQFNKYGDTRLALYLPQLMQPHRRQIHGLFVDLQAKLERLNQDS